MPYIVVTSRAQEPDFYITKATEHKKGMEPVFELKKVVVVTGRVHPGESNASFMMEGFISFITSQDPVAVELRKRIVFKIIPFTNPDGVIVGNYRVSFSGHDLNRKYSNPHPKLHPIVTSVKQLISESKDAGQQILAFIDLHGHSRKKNVFMYGPEFPIHDPRYLQCRGIPKLLSEKTEMFRFFSCKFRVTPSKETTARVVLWREFRIANCFTLEASFHGFFNSERVTLDFVHEHLKEIGSHLSTSLFEFGIMLEADERIQKEKRERIKQIAAARSTKK